MNPAHDNADGANLALGGANANPGNANPAPGGANNNGAANQNPNYPPRDYVDVRMSVNSYLFRAHLYRIAGTIIDDEDRPLLEENVRFPTAPKKGKERALNKSMPGASENDKDVFYRPGMDPAYMADIFNLQEQRIAAKLRNKRRGRKRRHPSSRKGLFGESGGANSSDDIKIKPKDIPWE